MASRIIASYGSSNSFIQKCIPYVSSLEGFNFPSLDEFFDNPNILIRYQSKLDITIFSAIQQQYYEWYNWFSSDEDIRSFLAPIVGTVTDERTLPVLIEPIFTPIISDVTVDNYNALEQFLIMGMHLQKYEISEQTIITFLRKIPTICSVLGLIEDDIINNPSNIGYNPDFGLRIIDYGLVDKYLTFSEN